MDNLQFYPTPPEMAYRAWKKFKNKNFIRVLEPSAGRGALAAAYKAVDPNGHRRITIDACEIDPTKHPDLIAKGVNVVGLDFLQCQSGSIYSHIILNPPFAEGARHVLKAWQILWDGEIVAIINAETVRNPYTKEREQLVKLILEHGECEFIQGAFAVDDAERKTEVEVALVYLKKTANMQVDIIGNLYEELSEDTASKESLARGFNEDLLPSLPNSQIENQVLAFNAAVRAMKEAVFASARAGYYSAMLGETMAVRMAGGSTSEDSSVEWVQKEIAERYAKLKDKAWASILRGTQIREHLSSKAQRRLESEFDNIKKLEFSIPNIHGFLLGLIEKQSEIMLDMCCDIFDMFIGWQSDNAVIYKSWKSNEKHRVGMKLRASRMILPNNGSWSRSLSYEAERRLADFDRVFAMLDGKRDPEVSLVSVFNQRFSDLKSGERVSASYFDVRYYPGAGTIHFFPREKKLLDRLNRLVGQHRQWLPPETEKVAEAFWLQYDKAESFDRELREEAAKNVSRADRYEYGCGGVFSAITSSHEEYREKAGKLLDMATTAVLERHGISVDFQLEHSAAKVPLLEAPAQQLPLLEAA